MLLVAVGIGSLTVGSALGIAFRFLVLIPATLILIALLSATWSTAEAMLVAWVGVQVGYLGGAAARMLVDLWIRRSRPMVKDLSH
jgi:hypothetical protein